MTKARIKELYKKLENTNGAETQRLICVEELSELAKEILKYNRGFNNKNAIAEEAADVLITVEQLIQSMDLTEAVEVWYEYKIMRTKVRLEELKAE